MTTTLAELSRRRGGLSDDDIEHLQHLVAQWGIVADFCFSDLLLFVRVPEDRFAVVGQIRPTTSQTLYGDDLVGLELAGAHRALVDRALRTGEITRGEGVLLSEGAPVEIECIPVRREGQAIAVVSREFAPVAARRPGRLERVYLDIAERFFAMIAAGEFPFPGHDDHTGEAPRVGDGVIVVDADRRVTFASPNAVSALHRMGVYANAEGRTLATVGVGADVVDSCFTAAMPAVAEVERVPVRTDDPGEDVARWTGNRVVVLFRAIPLLVSGRAAGAVVLLRDVSDIRRRDRMLLSKDAAIREVHHRVKNNLQTISALLRLQGRRLSSAEAKLAIEESVRRIRSIALVHETLSRETGDAVPFDDIVRPLVRMVEESLLSPDRRIRFVVEGDAGDLPAEVATPLAVVLTELLQNAVEHGFPEGAVHPEGVGHVVVTLSREGSQLRVVVRDDGVGLPADFSMTESSNLGLSIVRTLVTNELGGDITFRSDAGTVAELRLPTRPRGREGA